MGQIKNIKLHIVTDIKVSNMACEGNDTRAKVLTALQLVCSLILIIISFASEHHHGAWSHINFIVIIIASIIGTVISRTTDTVSSKIWRFICVVCVIVLSITTAIAFLVDVIECGKHEDDECLGFKIPELILLVIITICSIISARITLKITDLASIGTMGETVHNSHGQQPPQQQQQQQQPHTMEIIYNSHTSQPPPQQHIGYNC